MKKFKFRLQKLLEAKKAQEKAIQNELIPLVGEQNRLRMKQQEYMQKVAAQRDTYHTLMEEGKTDFKSLQLFNKFSDFVDKFLQGSQQEIDAMQPDIDKVNGRLIEATKERRVLEKLKERRYNEWLYEVNRADNKENDDMNQKIYMRNIAQKEEE
jgi:flagellar protein FliJ